MDCWLQLPIHVCTSRILLQATIGALVDLGQQKAVVCFQGVPLQAFRIHSLWGMWGMHLWLPHSLYHRSAAAFASCLCTLCEVWGCSIVIGLGTRLLSRLQFLSPGDTIGLPRRLIKCIPSNGLHICLHNVAVKLSE